MPHLAFDVLHDAVAAVCPILGVSMGNPNDKSTCRIDFAPSATPAEQQAARAVVAGFNPSPITVGAGSPIVAGFSYAVGSDGNLYVRGPKGTLSRVGSP